MKYKCKDSKEIAYIYNVSTNRDFIKDENGYWFNFKDGKLGKYFYDPKTKQIGYKDGDYGFLGSKSEKRVSSSYENFINGD